MTERKSIDEVLAGLDEVDPALAEEIASWNPVVGIVRAIVGLRKRANLTQAELAARLGRKQSAIARLESAEQDPRWTTVHETLAALGHRIQIVPAEGNLVLLTEEQLDEFVQHHVSEVLDQLRKQALSDALVHLSEKHQAERTSARDRADDLVVSY